MFNKIILVGNMTRDVELRYTQGGMAIGKTAIATSRKFTSNGEKKEEVCYVDITAFGRSGEILNQYCRKGSKILVEGRLTFEQWVDNNGQKKSKHSVTIESLQMLDTKGSAGGQTGQNAPVYHENIPQPHPQYNNQQAKTNNELREEHQKTAHEPSMGQEVPEIDVNG